MPKIKIKVYERSKFINVPDEEWCDSSVDDKFQYIKEEIEHQGMLDFSFEEVN